jgi:hypothetical protein
MKEAFEKREAIAIYESSDFYARIIKFANSGCGMSEGWWSETYRMKDEGELVGVYQTQSGELRRTTIWSYWFIYS